MAVAFLIALAVGLAATPIAAWVARRLGVLDRPGPLKVHREPVPYLGGVAVFIAVAATWRRPAFLIPLGLALALGTAEDTWGLPPRIRIAGLAVVAACAAAVARTALVEPLGSACVVLAVLLLTNALNMVDGLDGLAAAVTIASAAGFAALLDGEEAALAAALGGSLLAFLAFNRPPAHIYLGDGGAYVLGTALALLLASATAPGVPLRVPIAALPLVAFPVTEATFAVIRRARAHRPLYEGDREHIYDKLVARGLTARRATVACVIAQTVLCVIGVGASRLPAAAALAVAIACAGAIFAVGGLAGFLAPAARIG